MNRGQPVGLLLLVFLALGLIAQLVPLYTDWLWFQEVGYTQVFTTTLALRGALFTSLALTVLIFLYINLTLAARTAAPDVIWELEDQLGLPGRVVIEPLIRRFLPLVLFMIALVAGLRATAHWETLLGYLNATEFGGADPLFGRDLAFFVFVLPFWRLLYGWAVTLAVSTIVLTLVVYILQRSLVLTTRGPRLAVGARTHLLALGALALALKAVGFWLDRFELVFSPRGIVFGASYTDIHASLPALSVLAVVSGVAAAACLAQIARPGVRLVVGGLIVLGLVWVIGLGIYPTLLQRFSVTPNELVAERPFIEHNIRMTRQAYGLDRIEERSFPADETLDARALERNAPTIENIRLWDHRPLLRTFGQLQEIRTYYKFVDVDNDRYTMNGEYKQLMLAVRFGEIKILLANDLTAESRIMIHRAIVPRVRQITPFFRFDRDPYMVVTDDGRLVWMLDGYTTTTRYPYSDPVPGVGNYVRNSVKVTIDAYHGAVRYYLADPTDPIVRAYSRAFHGLFQPLDAMPADLRAHLRYPEDFFAIQARKYATYHMRDPQVFYNKEDLWTVPPRTIDGREREMEPYYTIMRLPGEKKEEFILLTLYNPSRRDNIISWLDSRSAPPNYGKLPLFDFPKQKLVFGPRQIDARIDQDPVISQQLSLWNQRGSTVIRGSLLAIPLDQSLIYVQPLYLAASRSE